MSTRALFVYGSLKRGGLHHDKLRGATFLGLGRTESGYELVAVGAYLGLVPAALGSPEARVTGEVYAVPEDLLPALDAFEGSEYRRARLLVELLNSEQRPEKRMALAYVVRTR